jgi:hypothetical protein
VAVRDEDLSAFYRMRAFQWLSCAAPLIWAKLLSVFDGKCSSFYLSAISASSEVPSLPFSQSIAILGSYFRVVD